jgi:hypothetical protein
LRHLAAREPRGKEFVEQLMSRSQVYVKVTRGLADLHSELLRYQIDTGSNGNAFLGYLFLSQVEKNKILKLLSFLSVVVFISVSNIIVCHFCQG